MSTIKELFKKDLDDITIEDVVEYLKELKESPIVEFKGGKMEKDHFKSVIIKYLIGFLNSEVGKGLLILGLNDKDLTPEPIPLHRLSRAEIINWIRDYIDYIPKSPLRPYTEIIKEIKVDDGYVYLIDIWRIENAVFFSKKYPTSFVRIGDQTNKLNFRDMYELMAQRIYPKPYLLFKVSKYDLDNNRLKIVWIPIAYNEGSEPSINTVFLIKIRGEGIMEINSKNIKDVSEFQIGIPDSKTFQIDLSSWSPDPLYPDLYHMINGNITIITKMNFKLDVEVSGYDMKGHTKAYYQINTMHILHHPTMLLKYKKSSYWPYL